MTALETALLAALPSLVAAIAAYLRAAAAERQLHVHMLEAAQRATPAAPTPQVSGPNSHA